MRKSRNTFPAQFDIDQALLLSPLTGFTVY